MSTAKALIFAGPDKAEIREVPHPEIGQGELLVKTRAVAINPTDWKSLSKAGEKWFGTRLGCDLTGEVVEVGPGVTRDIKKGDRTAGFVFGASTTRPDNGAFGEYVRVKEHIQAKIPDHVTDEEAATLGISVTTVGQGLYKTLQLPLPNNPAKTAFPILIYGGSTATGIYGIKYAKLSGLTVIATSSPHNFALLKSIGADHVFDYRSATAGAEIRALTDNKLEYAWDCTGYGAAVCAAALSDRGRPKYATIIPVKEEELLDVNPVVDGPYFTLGYDAMGEPFERMGQGMWTPSKEEVDYARMFWELSEELLASGKLTPLKPEVNRLGSGLEGVIKGLDELKNGRVSGSKLVYTL
ncbi:GroES-like protein [Poronia punctata]|nr:GroES-like protein [Poronia punctata]